MYGYMVYAIDIHYMHFAMAETVLIINITSECYAFISRGYKNIKIIIDQNEPEFMNGINTGLSLPESIFLYIPNSHNVLRPV